jgi:lactose/cellobiose-specific phosphotransferase system IIC component
MQRPDVRIARGRLWLEAIKNGFISLLPLTFFRVVAECVQQFPGIAHSLGLSWIETAPWIAAIHPFIAAIYNVHGLMLAAMIAIHLSRALRHNCDPTLGLPALSIGISALINYLMFAQAALRPSSSYGDVFYGIFIGIGSAELCAWLFQRRMTLPGMPSNADINFYQSLRTSAPVVAGGLVSLLLGWAYGQVQLNPDSLIDYALRALQSPTHGVWTLSLAATLLNQVFWFMGVHGSLAMETHTSLLFYSPGSIIGNAKAWKPLFDGFIQLGGSGATLGLLLAIFTTARPGAQRQIAKLSLIPALFNINDSLLYGLPIVMNARFLLPFIAVPLLLTGLSVAAVHWGLFTLVNFTLPWTTPPLLSGALLTGSWRGLVWQLFEIAISYRLYLPVVQAAEQLGQKNSAEALALTLKTLIQPSTPGNGILQRKDQVGIIARSLLADLRCSIQRNQLSLAYQPKHNREGKVIGVEALLRWTHPKHGAISPAAAVTLAEESGYIRELGLHVLDIAAACKARWNARGHGALTVAVNVSPKQLRDHDFPARVQRCLRKHGLQPGEVELEITESSTIEDSEGVNRTLAKLREIGVRLALDDFGMGFSSLLFLRRFRVETIKLDGSITRDILHNPISVDIVRSITALGQAQQLEIVAEFVESQEQRIALANIGCDTFQGYYHSPPLSEKHCLDYFRANGSAPSVDIG